MNELHAHEIIEMMHESRELYTRESLAAAIIEQFGRGTRFFACDANGMNATQVVEYLASRGKFARHAGGFTVAIESLCAH